MRSLVVSHRVLVTDPLAEEGLALLRAEPGLEVVVASKLEPAKLKAMLAEADGIVIRSGTQLTAEVLRDQPRLKVVVRAFLLEAGRIRASVTSDEMMKTDTIKQAYLGV